MNRKVQPGQPERARSHSGGVGPAGSYTIGLDAERQAQLRERCREMLPAAPFVLTAQAWAARGIV